MHKIFYILFSLSLVIPAKGNILRVGKTAGCKTIQQAIVMVSNGDTILVEAGFYSEKNIAIRKKIILMGSGYPVLDGDNKFEIISIYSDNVVVTGFKLQHTGRSSMDDIAAIKIYNGRNVVIQNNIVDDGFFGIYAEGAHHCKITGNRLTAYHSGEEESGNGIHCWKSDSMEITNNTIRGHRDGIYFEFVTNSLISCNISEHNIRYGLHFMFSHNNSYLHNIFRFNGAGVAVMYTHGVKMTGNSFENNWGDASYGLLLKEISDSYIEGNKFIKNTTGIMMEGGTRITMIKNTFQNNGWALKIQASSISNKINNNNFIANTFDVGTNGSLSLNDFTNNYWDKYDGYDINRDGKGDVPYHPVSLYSMIVERNPPSMLLFRSFIVSLMDKTEKVLPGITPENLKDDQPLMKPLPL
ncbi:MAG TPA: nitrous oxide reductase family maturation protein NosD [Chitinophagaceae bacterium]|nr:nitrous oxide reductase family maturation protein NosD [Chitinophagaceae bacterium]